MSTTTRPDQTYLVILSAAAAQEQAQVNHNARILAEHGTNQLGRPWTKHPGWRIWNGNLCKIGHHDRDTFIQEANAILPTSMYVDLAHHSHAHLTPPYSAGYPRDDVDWNHWVNCAATDNGAVPITFAVTQTRGD